MSQQWVAAGASPRAVKRHRFARSPWRLLAELFIGAAIIYGALLGGHADTVIALLSKHTSSAASQVGFTIGRVTIAGQRRTEDEAVIKALGVGGGESILSFDTAKAQKRLEDLPWVRQAEVMRLLPSTLKVILDERRPRARWQLKGKIYLIDSDGAVIGDADSGRDGALPLIVGAGAATRYAELERLLARHATLRSRLRAAVRVADRRWTLKLDDGVDILLPEERLADALDWVMEADRDRALLTRALVAVDMRLGDRVTLRLSDDAARPRKASAAAQGGISGRAAGQDT